jgi:hypothetical protein
MCVAGIKKLKGKKLPASAKNRQAPFPFPTILTMPVNEWRDEVNL